MGFPRNRTTPSRHDSDDGISLDNSSTAWKELPPNRDETQVKLDVDRSFVYYPNGMACRGNDKLPMQLTGGILQNNQKPNSTVGNPNCPLS